MVIDNNKVGSTKLSKWIRKAKVKQQDDKQEMRKQMGGYVFFPMSRIDSLN